MSSLRKARRRIPEEAVAPRVGLFGLLGQGNLGNDGSLEAVLAYLEAEHPDAILDCFCSGPEQVTSRYGVKAAHLWWYRPERHQTANVASLPLKTLGKLIDAFNTASWVRRHDVVIVPGMGVLEATVPLRPGQTPYAMFLLCASGRLFGTKVALVSVGANVIHRRLTRWLMIAAARLAYYRSFRDASSRDAMRRMGLDASGDAVYPDVCFSLPVPRGEQGADGTVGIGVMDYYGGDDDRRRGEEIHRSYGETIKRFVLLLIDRGRQVRLFTGDVHDEPVMREILADVRAQRPGLGPSQLIAEPASSLGELLRQMASVNVIVATRFHNVLCALMLAKPTLSLGYAVKHETLMADMGLSEFCQSAKSLDLDRMIEQLTGLENRAAQLREEMLERNAEKVRLVHDQFAELSAVLFQRVEEARTEAGRDEFTLRRRL